MCFFYPFVLLFVCESGGVVVWNDLIFIGFYFLTCVHILEKEER